jgi:hypothetical protein
MNRKLTANLPQKNSATLGRLYATVRLHTYTKTDYAIILYYEVPNFSALNRLNTYVQLHISTETLPICNHTILSGPKCCCTDQTKHKCSAAHTRKKCQYTIIPPPINPNPHLHLMVMWRSVPWVMWEEVTGVEVTPCRGLLGHMLANGALVYPSQDERYHAEGCIALGWKQQCCSVVSDPLGEPDHNPLYVGPLSTWGSADGDHMFSPLCHGRALNWGFWEIWMNEWINHWLWKWSIALQRGSTRELGRAAPLAGTLRERWDFVLSGDSVYWGLQKVCKKRLSKQAFLSMGEPAGRLIYWGLWEMDEEGLWKWSTYVTALSWEPERGFLYWWLWRKQTSFSIVAPLGELWRVCSFGREFDRKVRFYQETLFIGESKWYIKEGSGNRQLSS